MRCVVWWWQDTTHAAFPAPSPTTTSAPHMALNAADSKAMSLTKEQVEMLKASPLTRASFTFPEPPVPAETDPGYATAMKLVSHSLTHSPCFGRIFFFFLPYFLAPFVCAVY
jgi:hypothetical protein